MMRQKAFNAFEKILLVIGVFVVIIGYFVIQKMISLSGGLLTWEAVMSVFLWVLVILMIVLIAANENIKEELKYISQNQVMELKLIKEELRYLKPRKRR